MAATESDDATATFKGDDEIDFGQEANKDKAKAKSDDAKASGKTSGKATKDAAKNRGKEADGEAENSDDAAKIRGKDAEGQAGSDEKAFVSPEEPMKSARLAWEARVAAVEARDAGKDFPKLQDVRAQAKRTGAGAKERTTSQRIKPDK